MQQVGRLMQVLKAQGKTLLVITHDHGRPDAGDQAHGHTRCILYHAGTHFIGFLCWGTQARAAACERKFSWVQPTPSAATRSCRRWGWRAWPTATL